MKKAIWIICFLGILAGLVFLLRSTLSPKPVRLVKPSTFNSEKQVGELIWERYQDQFKKEKIWILGVESGSIGQMKVIQAFIQAAEKSGMQFDHKLKEVRLNPEGWSEVATWPDIDLRRKINPFIEQIKNIESGIILLPNTFVSHLIALTPVKKLEKALGKKFLSISMVRFVLSMEDLGLLYPSCDGQAAFGEPTVAALGCAAKRKSISSFRKKLDRNRYVMAMEQNGEKDFLVYFWKPKSL